MLFRNNIRNCVVNVTTRKVLLHTTKPALNSVLEETKNHLPKDKLNYEFKNYQIPKWKEHLGELVIKLFRMDMDKIRSGPIAGSYYYNICKEPGFIKDNVVASDHNKFFYNELQLPRTFAQWFQITSLHEWMLFVRMRAMPFKYGRNYQQKLVDSTFSDMELRLFKEMNIHSGSIADRYLKDFNSQLRGAVFSYDEGFFTDDVTLMTAVWRNLFSGRTDINMKHLELVIKYIRSQLYVLNQICDRDFALGKFNFISPFESIKTLSKEQLIDMKKETIKKYEKLDETGELAPSEKSKLSYTN